ncbi:hypothetical protein ACFSJ0_31000 [Nonomuraea guangzhouensis]|uniref:Uncharacterized protein n=1 Tax=Nonomuraea guangzhouensis TaxID=1291555 RepID=A0ABW4GGF4_9ACTN
MTDRVEHALEATIGQLTAAARLIANCRIVGVDALMGALKRATVDGPEAVDARKIFEYVHQALAEYLNTGDPDVLAALTDAVAYAYIVIPVGSLQAVFSEALGVVLRQHFVTTGDESALTRAARALRLAVADADENSPARISHLSNLGNALRTSASVHDSPELLAESRGHPAHRARPRLLQRAAFGRREP